MMPGEFVFPDMRAHFILNRRPADRRAALALCEKTFESIALRYLPAAGEIARVATEQSAILSQFRKPSGMIFADASAVLNKALLQIYENGSIMGALVSTNASDFRSANPDDFIQWLEQQRLAGGPRIEPIEICSEKQIDQAGPSTPEINNFVASKTRAAARVNVQLRRTEVDAISATLHHTVALGVTPRTAPVAMQKFCNQAHSFKSAGSGTATFVARILCLREVQFGEFWIMFFCDPQDCTSDRARFVSESISQDSEIKRAARVDTYGTARGPYNIDLTARE